MVFPQRLFATSALDFTYSLRRQVPQRPCHLIFQSLMFLVSFSWWDSPAERAASEFAPHSAALAGDVIFLSDRAIFAPPSPTASLYSSPSHSMSLYRDNAALGQSVSSVSLRTNRTNSIEGHNDSENFATSHSSVESSGGLWQTATANDAQTTAFAARASSSIFYRRSHTSQSSVESISSQPSQNGSAPRIASPSPSDSDMDSPSSSIHDEEDIELLSSDSDLPSAAGGTLAKRRRLRQLPHYVAPGLSKGEGSGILEDVDDQMSEGSFESLFDILGTSSAQ